METKRISYAYPSSIYATKHGFKNGCFMVLFVKDGWIINEFAAFATIEEAKKACAAMPLPFCAQTAKYHPEWVC